MWSTCEGLLRRPACVINAKPAKVCQHSQQRPESNPPLPGCEGSGPILRTRAAAVSLYATRRWRAVAARRTSRCPGRSPASCPHVAVYARHKMGRGPGAGGRSAAR